MGAVFWLMLGIHEACRLFIRIIDNNHLAWFYVTDIMSTHQIKGTGFTGNNPAMIKTSQTKRPKTIRITERNQFIITHDEDGKSTLDCIGSLRYALFQGLFAGTGNQGQNDLAINRSLEYVSFLGKLLPQASCICQVTIMGQAEISPIIEHFQRLDIVSHTAARRGITDMTNANISVKTLES